MLLIRRGQAFIEYIMIVLIVLVVILVGGPILKRSLFGAFKMQEDSVLDSFSEQMRQSTTSLIPPPVCSCSGWTATTCGNSGCEPTQMASIRTCTPIDCQAEDRCVAQTSCCTTPGLINVGCGTLIHSAAGENADIIGALTRATVDTNYFTAALGTFDGTIYLGGVDSHDCLSGELIVSRTCGVPPVPGDPTDPAQVGKTTQVFACVANYSSCRPGCWGQVETGSADCNPSEIGRNDLYNEVSYRKRGGVITGGVLTPDFPRRKLISATASMTFLGNPPYNGGVGSPTDPNIYMGAWLLPWTYFYRPTAGPSPECSVNRMCERTCPLGDLPSSDRSGCTTPKCDWITDSKKELARNTAGALTYVSPQMIMPENFLMTVEGFNLNYIIGCFDRQGNITGGVNQARILAFPDVSCTSGPFTVAERRYCFQDNNAPGPIGATIPTTANAICPDSFQVAVRVYNPTPNLITTDWLYSNDFISYRVDYQQHNVGAMVSLLVDDYVDIYASDSTFTPGQLLYSSPRIPPTSTLRVPWQFPAEFYAPGANAGNIYLVAVHQNLLGVPDGNTNPGGISLQEKGFAPGTGCFTESVPIYSPHGARPLPSPPGFPWLNNGCWIYSVLNNGLDTQGVDHTLHLQAPIPGTAPRCGCVPACAGTQYCIKGSCVTYNPSICQPPLAFVSSFETPNLAAGTSQIMTAAFDRWQFISGPGVELEYDNALYTFPAPYTGTTLYAANGHQYLQMASANGAGSTICTVPFTTTPGQPYRLSFYMGLRADALANCVNDSQIVVTHPSGSTFLNASTTWEIKNIDFTATAASSTICFTDVDIPQAEVYVDNTAAALTGAWTSDTTQPIYYLFDDLHDGNAGKGTKSVRFSPFLCAAGQWRVEMWYPTYTNVPPDPLARATNVPVDIVHSLGTTTVLVNEAINGNAWFNLGTYQFPAVGGSVNVRTTGTTGYVVADAFRFTRIPTIPTTSMGAFIDQVTVRKRCPVPTYPSPEP